MQRAFYKSPLGCLELIEQNDCLTNLGFVDTLPTGDNQERLSHLLIRVCRQLDEYFAGKRKKFDLPLDPRGTNFQQKVWLELQNIDYGTTKTYADIAASLNMPKACRAVGQANNKNPIAIIIPCHRVVGKSGKLVGYAAGLDIKQKLLELEKQYK